MYAVLNRLPLNYLCPLSFHSLSLSLSFLPSPSPPRLPHWDGLMEIIQKWKSPGFTGSLSNHICSSQRRHSSNWGTHFLTLLKGHLLFRQCKHCLSFACSGVFYDCNSFFPSNNGGQCPEFIYFILYISLFITSVWLWELWGIYYLCKKSI